MEALLVCLLIRFNIGSTETLNIPNIRQQVVDYYHSRYSSNLVRTAVYYCMCCSAEWCSVTSCIVKWSEGQVVSLLMFLGAYCWGSVRCMQTFVGAYCWGPFEA